MDAAAAIALVKDPKFRNGLEWFASHAGHRRKVPLKTPEGIYLHHS